MSSGDTVLPSQHNPAMQDLGQSVGNSLSRDGLGGMRADLAMGGYNITNANNVSVGGTLTIADVAFNPALYARLDGNPVFTGGGVVSARGQSTFGYATLNTGGVNTTGFFGFFRPNGVRAGYIGNVSGVSGPATLEIINETGGDIYLNQRARIFSEFIPRSTRGNQFGVLFTDGTASPSGGSDGDFYFQYTP